MTDASHTADPATTTATSEPDRQEERWVYGGVRVLNGKRVHAWGTDAGHGRELYFSMKGTYSIGEIYRATCDPKAHTPVVGDPSYNADGRVDTDQAAELRARHHAAQTRLSLAKLDAPPRAATNSTTP